VSGRRQPSASTLPPLAAIGTISSLKWPAFAARPPAAGCERQGFLLLAAQCHRLATFSAVSPI